MPTSVALGLGLSSTTGHVQGNLGFIVTRPLSHWRGLIGNGAVWLQQYSARHPLLVSVVSTAAVLSFWTGQYIYRNWKSIRLTFYRQIYVSSIFIPIYIHYRLTAYRLNAKYSLRTQKRASLSKDEAHDDLEKEREERAAEWDELHELYAPRVLQAMQHLGGLYVKMGQVYGSRTDAVPHAYQKRFITLVDQAPSLPWALMRDKMEYDMGCKLDTLFKEFDETPVAAASMGQVFSARLKEPYTPAEEEPQNLAVSPKSNISRGGLRHVAAELTSKESTVDSPSSIRSSSPSRRAAHRDDLRPFDKVAVKSIYPNIYLILSADLDAMVTMAYFISRDQYQFVKSVREQFLLECNMTREARMQHLIGQSLRKRFGNKVRVPHIVWRDPMVTPGTMVMEFMEDCVPLTKLASSMALDESTLQKGVTGAILSSYIKSRVKSVVTLMSEVLLYQMLVDGRFHGDPHPGNWLVPKNGNGPLILLDFGQVQEVDHAARRRIARLFYAVARNDSEKQLARLMRELGFRTERDRDATYAFIARTMFDSDRIQVPEGEGSLAEYFMKRLQEDPVEKSPSEFTFAVRVGIMMRGVIGLTGLEGEVRLSQIAKPFAEEAFRTTEAPSRSRSPSRTNIEFDRSPSRIENLV